MFPDEERMHIGRAVVLKDLGRLDEALEMFEQIKFAFQDSCIAHCGQADVLKEMGRLDKALLSY